MDVSLSHELLDYSSSTLSTPLTLPGQPNPLESDIALQTIVCLAQAHATFNSHQYTLNTAGSVS